MGLTFDGVDIEATYGVVVNGASTWVKPQRDVERVHVPGRNGDILFDNGCWLNVEITYDFLIKDGWKTNAENFIAWLYSHVGYFRLEDLERHPGVYRMASFVGPMNPDIWFTTETGVVKVTFNCKPQQWLLSGETPIESTVGMIFPGYIDPSDESSPGSYDDFTFKTVADLTSRCTPLVTIPPHAGSVNAVTMTVKNNSNSAKVYDFVCAFIDSSNGNKKAFTAQKTAQSGATVTQNWNSVGTDRDYYYAMSVTCEDELDGDDVTAQIYTYPAVSMTIPQMQEVLNPTGFESFPTLSINSPKGGVFVFENHTVLVGATTLSNITIDCDLEDCYSVIGGETVNANQHVTISKSNARELRDFPYFKPGTNKFDIFVSPDYVIDEYKEIDLRIIPNWFRI